MPHHRPFVTFVLAGSLALAGGALSQTPDVLEFLPAPGLPNAPPLPPPTPDSVQLVLDDDGAEGSLGIDQGAGARQFLWLNQFAAPAGGFDLEQIWVLFPIEPELAVGQSIDLVVYHDPDGDPTNGADHLATVAATIQVVDGTTFSIYPLMPAVAIPADGDVLIGVINRFVTSGVTPSNYPAAIDTNASQMRSWVAIWSGDPPAPPTLPTDGSLALIDSFPMLGGNWMIRGLGTRLAVPGADVPTLGTPGLLVLISVLLIFGLWRLRAARFEVLR